MKIFDFIKGLDMFGQSVSLRIKGEQSSNTWTGAFFTISLYIMVIVLFWFTILDVFFHLNPSSTFETQFKTKTEFVLDKFTFPFSIQLESFPSYAYHNITKYFTINAMLIHEENFVNVYNSTLEMDFCNKSDFFLFSDDIYYSAALDQSMCIKNQSLNLSRSLENNQVGYFTFTVDRCRNDPKCATDEEIDEFMKTNDISANLYFQNNLITPNNYSYPFDKSLEYKSILLDYDIFKEYKMFLKLQEFQSDNGLIFPHESTNFSISLDEVNWDVSSRKTNDAPAAIFSIYLSFKNDLIRRSYPKVQEVIANLGGLMSLLSPIAQIISGYFSKITADLLILNEIFDYCSEDDEKDKKKV